MIDQDNPLVQVRLWMLGPFRVEWRTQNGWQVVPQEKWGTNAHTRRLLQLLWCQGRNARRGTIIEELWEEQEPGRADEYLNKAAMRLRHILQAQAYPDLFQTIHHRTTYQLADQARLWVDAEAVQELLRETKQVGKTSSQGLALLQEAQGYFERGSFLADENGLWAHGTRGMLEAAGYRCALWLAEAYEIHEKLTEAEGVISRLYQRDPTNEEALCRWMALLHQQGMTHQAHRLFKETSRLFAQRAMPVSPATEAFAERLQHEVESFEGYVTLVEAPSQKDHEHSRVSFESRPIQGGGEAFVPLEPALLKLTPVSLAPSASRLRSLVQESETTLLANPSLQHVFDVGMQALILVGQHECWSVEQMHTALDLVLKTYSDMTQEKQKEKAVSRRDALKFLTGMSSALLALDGRGNTPSLLAEEIVSLCFITIPACWQLVYTGGIEHIEQVLPHYLTQITPLAHSSSSYRTLAASLASQAAKLANLLALRREDFGVALQQSQAAFTYGQLADDLNLQLAALIEEALTFWYRKRPLQALQVYQRAVSLLPREAQTAKRHQEVSPIIEGRIYVGLAEISAQLEQKQNALRYMGMAQEIFPEHPETDPHFAYTHYDHYYLYLYQGLMYLNLQQPEQALHAYAPFNAPQYAPRRAEIANRAAAAYLACEEMEQCCTTIETAVSSALSMGSDLRYSEAYEVYQRMVIKWPYERKVKDLVQVFQR